MDYLLRGILIGLLFGLPVGAVGTTTVQHTWNNGIKSGLFTGLGSSFAVGITNPAAILTFLFAFSYFGISAGAGLLQGNKNICNSKSWYEKGKQKNNNIQGGQQQKNQTGFYTKSFRN